MRTAVLLWIVRLALWCVPFAKIRALLNARRISRRNKHVRSGRPHHRDDLPRVARHVRLASRVVPRSSCLVRAFVAEQLLAEAGYESVLRIGAARTPDDRFTAHAWVECEGHVVVGGDVSGFAEFRRGDARVML
jgi:hypothetical protein